MASIATYISHLVFGVPTPSPNTPDIPKRPWKERWMQHVRFQTESSRLVAAFIFLILAGFICTVAIQLSDSRWFDYLEQIGGNDPKLRDLLLDQAYIQPTIVVDAVMLPLIIYTLVMLWVTAAGSSVKRIVAYRRLCWVLGFLYLCRALALSVTLLPSPVKNCKPKDATNQSLGDYIVRGILIVIGLGNTCTDLLFSGHTMFLTTCAVHFRVYCRNRWMAYVSYLWALCGMLMIIFTHFHYSVDVILAVIITLGTYAGYFMAVKNGMDRYQWSKTNQWNAAMMENRESMNDDVEKPAGRPRSDTFWGKYDEKYQAVVHMPRLYGAGLLRIVIWLDGIDLRFKRVFASDFPQRNPKPLDSTASEMSTRQDVTLIGHGDHSIDIPPSLQPLDTIVEVADADAGLGYVDANVRAKSPDIIRSV